MKILKVAQVDAVSGNGVFESRDISKPLNKVLCDLQKDKREVDKITYITNTRTGDITRAIVEYYAEMWYIFAHKDNG